METFIKYDMFMFIVGWWFYLAPSQKRKDDRRYDWRKEGNLRFFKKERDRTKTWSNSYRVSTAAWSVCVFTFNLYTQSYLCIFMTLFMLDCAWNKIQVGGGKRSGVLGREKSFALWCPGGRKQRPGFFLKSNRYATKSIMYREKALR